jgi:hypothetical protein
VRQMRATGLAGLLLLLTACGSTVPAGDEIQGAPGLQGEAPPELGGPVAPVGGSGSEDTALPHAPDASARNGSVTEPLNPASDGVPMQGDSQATARTPGVSPPRGLGARPVSAHPGVTETKIFIGLARDRSADPAISLGATIPRPPADQIRDALITHFNKDGGLAGRQLTPVYHEYRSSSKTYAQTQQEACSTFTEDRPVFAALNAGTFGLQTEDMTYQDCMAKAGVTTLGSAGTRGDAAAYRRLPSMIDISGLNYTRIARVYIDTLAARGFLTGKSRIGLLYVDRPDVQRAIRDALEARLAANGLRLASRFGFRQHQSDGEAGGTVSDLSSAVLQFREAGVDRVLFLESTGGAGPLLFMEQAESQKYYPRYGFTSNQSAQGLQSTYPEEQQRGAAGVGWVPMLDVAPAGRTPHSSAANECNAIIKAAGIGPPQNEVEEVQRLGLCEPFFFLAAALRQLTADGSPLSTSGLLRAIDRLGSNYTSTLGWYGNRFTPQQHDGAAGARYFTYLDDCSCYRSAGGIVDVS